MRSGKADIKRYAVAGLIGTVVSTAGYLIVVAALGGFDHSHMTMPFFLQVLFTYLLPVTFGAAFIGAMMYRAQTYNPSDGECRCRKCGYILKGLSKPECPECGEKL